MQVWLLFISLGCIFRLSVNKLASNRYKLDFPGAFSISVITAILATTIQAQDFQDVMGDKAVGRYTLPIAFPNFSRYTPLVTLVMWSLYLTAMWEITTPARVAFTFLGIIVGARYYFWRSTKDDEWSYVLYNVSCFTFHYLHLLSGFLNLDLVKYRICDARLLAHIQRECCTMMASESFYFRGYFNGSSYFLNPTNTILKYNACTIIHVFH